MAKGVSIHIGLDAVDPEHYSRPGRRVGRLREQPRRDMEVLAKALEYEPRTVILTKDATVTRMTGALTTAAQSLSAGDTLLLTYSGHGGQVPDKNGDESKKGADEIGEYADEYDETWVLYDRQLVDDELYTLWSEFAANVRIIVLSDSCHSGTVTRELPPWEAANVDPLPSRRLPMELQDPVYEENKRSTTRCRTTRRAATACRCREHRAHLRLHGQPDEWRRTRERLLHRPVARGVAEREVRRLTRATAPGNQRGNAAVPDTELLRHRPRGSELRHRARHSSI